MRENNKTMQRHRILRENPIGKITERGKNSLFSRGYSKFYRVKTLWSSLISSLRRMVSAFSEKSSSSPFLLVDLPVYIYSGVFGVGHVDSITA